MNAVVQVHGKPSLLATMAAKYGIDADRMLTTLKATAFRGDVSTEQLMALCLVANQYNLNPWTKEIYAFPDRSGIVPVVGVDGWSRIVNDHPQCDGIQFTEAEDGSWVECTIHRKDRKFPTTVREYLSEVKRDTGPWKTHPRRMLRHKALIQCARIVFGFSGIYDQDEAERIIESQPVTPYTEGEVADPQSVDKIVAEVTDILADDGGHDGELHADKIFAIHQRLYGDDIQYTAVCDALAKRGVIGKKAWKDTVAAGSKRAQEKAVEART